MGSFIKKARIKKFMKQIRILNKEKIGFLAFHIIRNKE